MYIYKPPITIEKHSGWQPEEVDYNTKTQRYDMRGDHWPIQTHRTTCERKKTIIIEKLSESIYGPNILKEIDLPFLDS